MNTERTRQIKALAMEMGFAAVGVAPATETPKSQALLDWIQAGRHGSMDYMARNLPLRLDPSQLVPGARSVVCLAVSYRDAGAKGDTDSIARYARGRDYHKVLKRQCIRLMDAIRDLAPDFEGRAFVDSAPVIERSLAAMSGLGWIGRNGCLIVPGLGSYVLLCEIICNLPLPADCPLEDSCGACGRCVEACPTKAILEDRALDARRCISYLTIEHKGEIPAELWPHMATRVFGCDACQHACPHNQDGRSPAAPGLAAAEDVHENRPRRSTGILPVSSMAVPAMSLPSGHGQDARETHGRDAHATIQTRSEMERELSGPDLSQTGLAAILRWREADWDIATRGRALRRATWPMFLRNATIAAGNSSQVSLIAPLKELHARSVGPLEFLRPIIDWALCRLAKVI